jgi:hypothetical protein
MFIDYIKVLIILACFLLNQCLTTEYERSNKSYENVNTSPLVDTHTRNTSVWTDDYEFGDGDEVKATESFPCSFYNDFLKDFIERTCYINLDIKNEKLGIFQSDGIYYYTIFFTDSERKELIDSLDKYIKWEEIADKKKETVEKEIGTVNSTVLWGIQNQTYGGTEYGDITVKFFSQNIYRHQLIIYYPRFNRDYIAFNSPPMYLEKESVKVLLSLLQDKSINKSILKIEKQIQEQNESYQ